MVSVQHVTGLTRMGFVQVKQSAQDHKMGAFECGILRLARVYALCKVRISVDDFMSSNLRMRCTQVDLDYLICWVGPYRCLLCFFLFLA